jgi:NMD protein affecting ribosome stability and mRNA decay
MSRSDDALPDTFAAFAGSCVECGDDVGRWQLTEGLCAACLKDAEVVE